jgi:PilZ domain
MLRWDSGESGAYFLNISETGALITSMNGPAVGQAIWLSLDEPMPTASIRGLVVRNDGFCRVGIDFEDRCPFDLHRAIILGVSFELLDGPPGGCA